MEVTVSKHNPLVTITKAPDIYDVLWSGKSIFLAGSIEMGAAVNWQDEITDTIAKNVEQSVNIYNPRREEWDSLFRSKH
jgi:hypothetical protein